jgi:hypothetical protein
VVNVAAGWYYSSATAVSSIRVLGARPSDQSRLKEIFSEAKDTPFSRLNGSNFESLAMELPGTKSARLSRNPFGRATLAIEYERPVASIRVGDKTGDVMLLGEGGSVFRVAKDEDVTGLPEVRVAPKLEFSPLGLANQFDGEALIAILKPAESRFGAAGYAVEVLAVNRFNVVIDGCRLELGNATKLEEKFAAYDALVRAYPTLLSDCESVIVTQPAKPACVPRAGKVVPYATGANSPQN